MPKALFTIPWVGLRGHAVMEASERAAPPGRAWGRPCGAVMLAPPAQGREWQVLGQRPRRSSPTEGLRAPPSGAPTPGTGSGPSEHLLPVRSRRGSRPMSSSGVESMMSWTSDHSSLLPMPGGHSGAWVGGGRGLLAPPVAVLEPPSPETPGQASVGGRVRGGFFWGTGGRARYLC